MLVISRAAVFAGPDRPLTIREFAIPELTDGELLVRTLLSTICGSDLKTYSGHRITPTPTVLGHEVLGRIEAFGPGSPPRDCHGRELEVGDRVTWAVVASCGGCFYCEHKLPQKCERLFKYGHQELGEHPLSGGLAEYCHLVAGTPILRVPDQLPDLVACPANCTTATAVAVLRRAGGCRGETVWIQGAGLLGLSACALARAGGARTILVSDVDEHRLELAQRFGADRCIDTSTNGDEITEAVHAATSGRGLDLVVELCGAKRAIPEGLKQLRVGGRYVLAGTVSPVGQIPLDPEAVVRRVLSIYGVHNYTAEDLSDAIAFLAAEHQSYPFAELVTKTFDLSDADAAFRYAIETRAPRVAVRP